MNTMTDEARDAENNRMLDLARNTLDAQLNNKFFTGQMIIEMNCKDGVISNISTQIKRNWARKIYFHGKEHLAEVE